MGNKRVVPPSSRNTATSFCCRCPVHTDTGPLSNPLESAPGDENPGGQPGHDPCSAYPRGPGGIRAGVEPPTFLCPAVVSPSSQALWGGLLAHPPGWGLIVQRQPVRGCSGSGWWEAFGSWRCQTAAWAGSHGPWVDGSRLSCWAAAYSRVGLGGPQQDWEGHRHLGSACPCSFCPPSSQRAQKRDYLSGMCSPQAAPEGWGLESRRADWKGRNVGSAQADGQSRAEEEKDRNPTGIRNRDSVKMEDPQSLLS